MFSLINAALFRSPSLAVNYQDSVALLAIAAFMAAVALAATQCPPRARPGWIRC